MDHSNPEQIVIATALSLLALFGEHYAPWVKLFGKPLGKIAAYTTGTLAMVLPFTWLLVKWYGWGREVTALWVIVLSSGVLVLVLNLADGKHEAEDTLSWRREEVRQLKAGEDAEDSGS